MAQGRKKRGRFAPTPSGELHFGNLLCALVAYLSAKSGGGEYLVRIEDLDPLRSPRSAADKILNTLDRFGLAGDAAPVYQSDRVELYEQKLKLLEAGGLTYPCFCSRAQLHAAEAPRLGDGGVVYPGTCRNLSEDERKERAKKRSPAVRVAVPDEEISFIDGLYGEVRQNLEKECGDFLIRRSDGIFAYQLAVTVDDGEQGVTEVVRGSDLLGSAPRQLWLLRTLGYAPIEYYHIPLVFDHRGRKLSKSDGDHISERLARLAPERILGALAYAADIIETDRAAELAELVEQFSFEKIKRQNKSGILLPEVLL